MAACMLVEVNTWLLIARRTLGGKLIEAAFYITWVGCGLGRAAWLIRLAGSALAQRPLPSGGLTIAFCMAPHTRAYPFFHHLAAHVAPPSLPPSRPPPARAPRSSRSAPCGTPTSFGPSSRSGAMRQRRAAPHGTPFSSRPSCRWGGGRGSCLGFEERECQRKSGHGAY
jgi:hypothetical protein